MLWIAALLIMGGGAGVILRLQAAQRLGNPGLKTSPLPDSQNLLVELPANVPGHESRAVPISESELGALPKDTSFGRRIYRAPDGFEVLSTAVLMGSDRTSIHQPQFCLVGQGLRIDEQQETRIPILEPSPYDLPVMKITSTKIIQQDGRETVVRGIYVYWFVAENRVTAQHHQRMWWMAGELLRSGVLQRWAYVSFFALCAPGQEDATYARLETLISRAVPLFQTAPPPGP